MENIKNNPQILAFINSQMNIGKSDQLNNIEQQKMIETLMKFQQFINQNANNENNNNNIEKQMEVQNCINEPKNDEQQNDEINKNDIYFDDDNEKYGNENNYNEEIEGYYNEEESNNDNAYNINNKEKQINENNNDNYEEIDINDNKYKETNNDNNPLYGHGYNNYDNDNIDDNNNKNNQIENNNVKDIDKIYDINDKINEKEKEIYESNIEKDKLDYDKKGEEIKNEKESDEIQTNENKVYDTNKINNENEDEVHCEDKNNKNENENEKIKLSYRTNYTFGNKKNKKEETHEILNEENKQFNELSKSINKIIEPEKDENQLYNNKKIEEEKHNTLKQNINNRPIDPSKVQNIDEIAVGPKCSNFLELLEKNLQNDNYQGSTLPKTLTGNENNSKPIKKYTPNRRKKPEVSIPKKGEMKKYKYYSDNFKEKDPYSEKITKEDKIKKAKEKAKNIEKNRQKINYKNVEQQREEQNNNMLNNNIAYNNNQDINLNVNNKWSKTKFELLDDKELINNIEKLKDDNSPLIGLEFGGGNSQQSAKNEGLNLKVGVRQGEISFKNIPRPKDLVLNNTNIKNQLNFENNKSTMPNNKSDLNKNKNNKINKNLSLNNQNNNSCGSIISKDKTNIEPQNKNKKNNLNLNINNFYYSKSMEKDDQEFLEKNDYIKKIEELDKEITK